ncbi:MAG TPA: sugar ABC transporter ATP-binding protein [Blastocatellia bacterium]|nr:sugar ABC transporter ATP-binding protein [Blastocatellia bacterium]
MSIPILQMKTISRRFPGVVALDRVDFEVYPGEIVALAGENGAGKSTLMNILGGIHQPDSGYLRIDDDEIVVNSVSDAIQIGIGFIHQELRVLDNLDIAENVFLGREPVWAGMLRLVDRQKIHLQADLYLKRLGLNISSRTPVKGLSIARQQMVEIAKALSLNARILIMDEPTSCLTETETARLFEVARELKAQGVSIIYITHRLGEIKNLADRVVVLRDGRNAGTLAGEEISHDRIVRLMVGRDLNRFRAPAASSGEAGYFRVLNLRTRRYPGHATSFDVCRGEILGLAGLVGAGRSDVAQAIFGVEPALEGTIQLDGKSIKIRSPKDAIVNGVYLMSEDRRRTGLILEMSIRENITLPALSAQASAGLIDRVAERRAAQDICGKLHIKAPSIESKAANLSGGNQQKVGLAKWLSLSPKVLIFDEPTRGVDIGAKAEIYQLMRRLAQDGVAIIMISSDMEEVLGESDRVAVMHEGAIAGILERNECSEEAIMRLAVGQGSTKGSW